MGSVLREADAETQTLSPRSTGVSSLTEEAGRALPRASERATPPGRCQAPACRSGGYGLHCSTLPSTPCPASAARDAHAEPSAPLCLAFHSGPDQQNVSLPAHSRAPVRRAHTGLKRRGSRAPTPGMSSGTRLPHRPGTPVRETARQYLQCCLVLLPVLKTNKKRKNRTGVSGDNDFCEARNCCEHMIKPPYLSRS